MFHKNIVTVGFDKDCFGVHTSKRNEAEFHEESYMSVLLEQAGRLAGDFWGVLTQMSPYLLFGFAMAGVLAILISPRLVERHLDHLKE